MSVKKIITIVATSPESFDDAVRQGVSKAARTLRGVCGAKVIEESAEVVDGKLTEFKVTMEIAFTLEGT